MLQVPTHRLAEIRRFFEDYKRNEEKVVTVGEFYGAQKARDTIMKAARAYELEFVAKAHRKLNDEVAS